MNNKVRFYFALITLIWCAILYYGVFCLSNPYRSFITISVGFVAVILAYGYVFEKYNK
jgi:hypothetical protein